jgi:hypothetical protein
VNAAMDDIGERFASDTATHRMTVLRDDGLYRHLRFTAMHLCNDAEWRTTNGFYWFDLITWPGNLTVNGDCGTYTFSRITDMFEFFRSRYGINPQYWAEKVRGETRTQSYSEDKFRQQVKEAVTEAEGECPGVSAAVEEQFYGPLAEWSIGYEDGARRALDEFSFYKDENDRYDRDKQPDFRFCDTWEWDLSDWDWTFLWCCHAIQWGIGQYDKQTPAGEAAPATLLSWVKRERAAASAATAAAPRTAAGSAPVATAAVATVAVAGGVL